VCSCWSVVVRVCVVVELSVVVRVCVFFDLSVVVSVCVVRECNYEGGV